MAGESVPHARCLDGEVMLLDLSRSNTGRWVGRRLTRRRDRDSCDMSALYAYVLVLAKPRPYSSAEAVVDAWGQLRHSIAAGGLRRVIKVANDGLDLVGVCSCWEIISDAKLNIDGRARLQCQTASTRHGDYWVRTRRVLQLIRLTLRAAQGNALHRKIH